MISTYETIPFLTLRLVRHEYNLDKEGGFNDKGGQMIKEESSNPFTKIGLPKTLGCENVGILEP